MNSLTIMIWCGNLLCILYGIDPLLVSTCVDLRYKNTVSQNEAVTMDILLFCDTDCQRKVLVVTDTDLSSRYRDLSSRRTTNMFDPRFSSTLYQHDLCRIYNTSKVLLLIKKNNNNILYNRNRNRVCQYLIVINLKKYLRTVPYFFSKQLILFMNVNNIHKIQGNIS